MMRPRKQLGAVGDFNDLAEIHDRDAPADMLDDGYIVGNEQIGKPELLLQIAEQVDDLRLNRDVERRNRLVADDEPGIERQRAGDADALALSTREFVRETVERLGPEPDLAGQHLDPVVEGAAPRDTVILQGLADDVADLEARDE